MQRRAFNAFKGFVSTSNATRFGNSASRKGLLRREDVISLTSTPTIAPSYPPGPYKFTDREYFIISYESDYDKIARVVPAPLKPKSNVVLYEWINMDSTGLGFYKESGTVIPCVLPSGEEVNYTLQMFLDCEPPIAAGREIWGFPKKFGNPDFSVFRDTVTGTLDYAQTRVATGTMAYKYKKMNEAEVLKSLTKTSVNLKIIPDVDFKTKIAQLVQYNLGEVDVKFAYEGPARLDLIPHINAPTAYLPVRKVIGGKHICADITLPYGSVLHDYLDENVEQPAEIEGALNRSEILSSPAMPVIAPSYKPATSYLDDRQYFIIRYKTEKGLLQKYVPDLFFVNEDDEIVVQWINTKATGIGDYSKVDIYVPVSDKYGTLYNFNLMTFLNSSASITFGREIYGIPQKHASPQFKVHRDTVTGTLDYAHSRVATATMQYHHTKLPIEQAIEYLKRSCINTKIIPCVDGKTNVIAQLVETDYNNINVKEAFEGPAALDLMGHVHAPLADFPVKEVIGGYSITCDVVMPQGRVYHDYLRTD